ncbi:MAG: signal peptide peptidase SppA [Deltaproteobacteria bacterium]|nr:signal peptide peptidase SppA [Deltaproteobacteria bacterium]
MARLHLGVLSLAIVVLSPAAMAQRQTDRLVLPVPSIAATDDASSLVVNPANLGFLGSYSLYYVHSELLRSDTPIVGLGDGVYLATPLLFGIVAGAGFEHLRPPSILGMANRGALSFGLAHGTSIVSLGVSTRTYISSQDPALDGLTSWDLGLTLRPWPWVSVAAGVRDLNAPAHGSTGIPRMWALGVGLRPTGRDAVQLTGEVAIDEDSGRVVPSGSVSLRVPWVGAVRAGFDLPRNPLGAGRELRAQVALDVTTSHVGAGAAMSSRRDEVSGWSAWARISGERYAGLPRPARVVDLTVEGALDVRESTRLARRLDRFRGDGAVDGVLLRVRGAEPPLAAAQEIRLRLHALRRSGRKVVCHLDDASANAYAMCTAADRIYVDPAGGIRLTGLRSQVLYFRGLLDNLGVRAEFVKIGEYKSAPEAFERTEASEPARRELDSLLDDYADQLAAQIARDRPGLATEGVRALFDRGPFVTSEALAARLIDGSVYEDQLDAALTEAFGRGVNLVEEPSSPARPRRWGTPGKIAIVYIDGSIVDGRSFTVPLLDMRFAGGRTIVESIQDAASDPSVAAIVLRIDSPGGSALASDQIWRAVWRARRIKPVVASMESIAASGGYYVASAATEIVANPATLTGSIGIFYGKFDLSGLLERIGINVQTFRRGRRADFDSMFRGFTDDERHMLQEKMRHFYGIFLRKVARGRGMDASAVDAIARGRVWSGRQARGRNLVDSYGGISEALWRARVLGHLPEDYEIRELPAEPGLIETLIGLAGARASSQEVPVPLPAGVRRSLRAAAPLLWARSEAPMALLPFVWEGP